MREIKFRGKVVDRDRWVIGDLFRYRHDADQPCVRCVIDGGDYEVEPETVGECLGVKDRNGAQLLTNKFLTVDKKDAAPLEEGEFYTFDIIGLDVFNLDAQKLGTVENVLKTGSNDVFVTRTPDGREILIPALKRVVKSIDLNQKMMIIDEATLEEI